MPQTRAADDAFVPFIPHADFRAGLPFGHFRVVVNPALALPYVVHLTRLKYLMLAVIGVGVALALSGYIVGGGLLVLLGIVLNRVLRRQAGRILLHLAARIEGVYTEATTHGVMEVRRV